MKITLTLIALLFLSGAAQAGELTDADRLQICTSSLTVATLAQKYIAEDTLTVAQLVTATKESNYDDIVEEVQLNLIAWGVYYASNSKSYLSSSFMQKCLAASMGPMDMPGPAQ